MEDNVRRGRPKRPLDERVSEALGKWELDFSDDNCWHGPRLLMVNGKNTSLLRAAFAIYLQQCGDPQWEDDELHPSWIVRRPNPAPCHDPTCRNPRHWMLDIRTWRGLGPKPIAVPLAQPVFEEDDVTGAAAMIMSLDADARRTMTSTALHEMWSVYSVSDFEDALNLLREQGEIPSGLDTH